MLNYLKIGGPLMWILFALSIISLTIILERVFYFLVKEKKLTRDFKTKLILAVSNNNKEEAFSLCKKEKNTIGSTIEEFLDRYRIDGDFHHFEQLVKEIAMERIGTLEKRIHILGIIAYTSPMIGLLGTVTGMILAFDSLGGVGGGDPAIVARGISQALLTTAAGLIIAIPAVIVYNLLNKRIEEVETDIDKITTNLINIIRKN